MLTYYSDDHHLHHGRCELIDGQLMPCFEKPQRADHILQRVKERRLGEVRGPADFGRAPIERIHSAAYLDFFENAWARWQAQGGQGDLLPYTWPARTLRQQLPESLHGQLGYYSFDAGAPITAGTWQAAYSAAQVALSAQQEISNGAQSAFALCRPPGHHAASEVMGGYCYLNNAAIAAQAFLDQDRARMNKWGQTAIYAATLYREICDPEYSAVRRSRTGSRPGVCWPGGCAERGWYGGETIHLSAP